MGPQTESSGSSPVSTTPQKSVALGIVRHSLTTAGGALAAKGFGDAEINAGIVGVIVALVGLIWSIVEKHQRTGGRLHLAPLALGLALLGSGCASFRTVQTDISSEGGAEIRRVQTVTTATTLFASEAKLADLKTTNTDKTQSTTVGAADLKTDERLDQTINAIAAGVIAGMRASQGIPPALPAE